MSDLEMLDVAVRYVYENRAWLTNEQIEMYIDADSLIEGMNIDEVKAVRERLKQQLRVVRKKYEEMLAAPPIYPPAPTPPLPASPPPEREDCAMCTDQWNCGCYMPNNELNERINTQDNDLWTDCNLGRMGLNCRNYIDEPQKEEQPSFITKDENYIDLTCDADGCTYGCGAKCGAEEEEDYSDMPPLLPLSSQVNRWPPITHPRTEIVGAQATPKGWFNPEEDTEDEEPVLRPPPPAPQPLQPQQLRTLSGYRHPELARMTTFATEEPPQAPKVKQLFPYNHAVWPSPRAKAVVQWLIRTGRTSKMTMRETLGEPISALTHEVCMRYLAAYYGLSHEQLLETSVFKLHNTPAMRSNGLLCGCGLCRSSRSLCSYEAY